MPKGEEILMEDQNLGSNFDDFLKEEGIFAEVEAAAVKRVIAYEIERMMEQNHLTRTELANRMHTSRSALKRLLDPNNTSITLQTLEKAAVALGKKLIIELA